MRQHIVDIGKSAYRPPTVPAQIDDMLDAVLAKADRIADPSEQSFFVMAHLPYLQPFADVNQRTSRLAANLPLIRANLCPLTFLGVPEQAYSRAVLGVYEMTRVERLRDLYVWAYERSTQEYLAIKQTVRQIVLQPERDPIDVIRQAVGAEIESEDRDVVEALIVDELRRLHEGVLARYGLRPSKLVRWLSAQR